MTTTTSGHELGDQDVAKASRAAWNASRVAECERFGRSSRSRTLRLLSDLEADRDEADPNESVGPDARERNDVNRETSDSAPEVAPYDGWRISEMS